MVPPNSAGSLLPVLPGTAACDPIGWRRCLLPCLPGTIVPPDGAGVSCHFCQRPLPVIPPDGAGVSCLLPVLPGTTVVPPDGTGSFISLGYRSTEKQGIESKQTRPDDDATTQRQNKTKHNNMAKY